MFALDLMNRNLEKVTTYTETLVIKVDRFHKRNGQQQTSPQAGEFEMKRLHVIIKDIFNKAKMFNIYQTRN